MFVVWVYKFLYSALVMIVLYNHRKNIICTLYILLLQLVQKVTSAHNLCDFTGSNMAVILKMFVTLFFHN